MQILIVILLPSEIEAEAKKISARYQPKLYTNKELPPHITLIMPADLIGKLDDVVKELRQMMEKQPHFEITIQGIDYFFKSNNVVYLNVKLSTQLKNFQKLIVQSLSSFIQTDSLKKFPFHPHITIAKKLEKDHLKKILKELKDYNRSFIFPLKEIGLFVIEEKEKFWRLNKKFLIKNKPRHL